MIWNVNKKRKKIKGVSGRFTGVSLSVDKKKVIDSSYGYVFCNDVNFDPKTKSIMLS